MTQEKQSFADMTVKQLMDLAKTAEISGRWDMTKPQLVEALSREQCMTKEVLPDKPVEEIPSVNVDDLELVIELDPQEVKAAYLDTVPAGTLVAFKTPDGKVKSAALVNRSREKRKLKLVTEYGAEFVCDFTDVLWVRTGKRWPRGVYQLLKGVVEDVKG